MHNGKCSYMVLYTNFIYGHCVDENKEKCARKTVLLAYTRTSTCMYSIRICTYLHMAKWNDVSCLKLSPIKKNICAHEAEPRFRDFLFCCQVYSLLSTGTSAVQ